MAYSGGYVFLNGKRRKDREDPQEFLSPHHADATIGDGEIRIEGYKMSADLYVAKERRSLDEYLISDHDWSHERWNEEHAWFGKIRGHLFGGIKYAEKERNQVAEFFLLEPSIKGPGGLLPAKKWTTTLGYMIGGGWEEDDEYDSMLTRVKPVRDWKIIYERIRTSYKKQISRYWRGFLSKQELDPSQLIRSAE